MNRIVRTAVIVTVGLGLAACSSGSSSSSPTPSSTASSTSSGIRDVRYCEIIPVTRKGATLTSEVYSTFNLNDCPASTWATITEDEVNQEYGSIQAKINGPRHWVMDAIIASGSSTDSPKFTFGASPGLETQRRGVIESKVNEGTVGDAYYVPNQVQRDTTFVYEAGKDVFELTDPDGNVYMMQSYAQINDPDLTYDQLAGLGTQLQLPSGWTYATRRLTEEYQLSTAAAGGVAYVINDDLLNSYQRR